MMGVRGTRTEYTHTHTHMPGDQNNRMTRTTGHYV